MTTPITSSTRPPDDPLAIAAMVCGALSLSGAGLLLGIPALILGIVSLKQGDNSRGLSIAGIVTGAVSTLLSLLAIGFVLWLVLSGTYDRVQPQHQTPTSERYDSSKV